MQILGPHRLRIRRAAIRIARLAFVSVVFFPHGAAEWAARVDRVCRTLAIGDSAHLGRSSLKMSFNSKDVLGTKLVRKLQGITTKFTDKRLQSEKLHEIWSLQVQSVW